MNEDAEQDESLQDAVRSYALRQQIASLHKEIMPELRNSVSGTSVFSMVARTSLKIAAGLIFLAFCAMLYLYFSTSKEDLFRSHYTSYAASAERGNPGDISTAKVNFIAGQKDLEKGHAAEAIRSFQKILDENAASGGKRFNDDAEYYLALSYLKAGQINKALPLFERIYDDRDHLYHDQVSGWYLFRLKMLVYKQR
jgi:tetratricopeptide (TPR) repeat protein